MKYSFIHAQTQQPLAEEQARASHDAGTGYGLLFDVSPKKFRAILSTKTVWLSFFDEFGRVVWALTWGRAGDEDLTIRNFSGTGYTPASKGQIAESELWKAMVMPQTNGKWRVRHSNAATWKSVQSEFEIQVPALPYPEFNALDAYLDFDYSSLEAAAQDFPPHLFPQGGLEPAPNIKTWTTGIG